VHPTPTKAIARKKSGQIYGSPFRSVEYSIAWTGLPTNDKKQQACNVFFRDTAFFPRQEKKAIWPVLHMKKSCNALTAEKWLYLSTRWCERINQRSQGSNPLMGHLAILCQEYTLPIQLAK